MKISQIHNEYKNSPSKIKKGDFVMIKRFPIKKSVYLPRYDGPFEVKETKSAGRMVVVTDRYGHQYDRNFNDVKLFHGRPQKYNQIKYEAMESTEKDKRENSQRSSMEKRSERRESSKQEHVRYPKRMVFPVERFGY